MTKNIKEIGKELLGKSLNSFHRKTGLTQLEKNNEMQDGILNGILSQVDDAYIEKTEQSNVIHLDGSGDGVVVLDSIEGNTMVNLFSKITSLSQVSNFNVDTMLSDDGWLTVTTNKDFATVATSIYANKNFDNIKTNTKYTLVFNYVCANNVNGNNNVRIYNDITNSGVSSIVTKTDGLYKLVFTTPETLDKSKFRIICYGNGVTGSAFKIGNFILLEGDYSDKEINYSEGLQSSFEEKINDEGKYEIEILSKNRTLSHEDYINHVNSFNIDNIKIKKSGNNLMFTDMGSYYENNFDEKRTLKLLPNTRYGLKVISNVDTPSNYIISGGLNKTKVSNNFYEFTTDDSGFVAIYPYSTGTNNLINTPFDIIIEPRDKFPADKLKQNKIKLLLDEPLRNKDKLCIKDGKIVIERNSKQSLLDGNLNWAVNKSDNEGIYSISTTDLVGVPKGYIISDKLPTTTTTKNEGVMLGITTGKVMVCIDRNKLTNTTLNGMKQYLNENPMQVVFDIETYYEEVLNEYGEPILLEGYENGTLYIDSKIVPTTTVRYTPKMESLNTLKEVNNNNNLTTLDINENIIPYMMDVDYMIMEKELLLLGTLDAYRIKNNRRIGENDMTSMQKRTGEMLERLFRGKSLTEQEARERVIIYLEANKITAEQANYLNEVILEVYA